MQTFNLSDMLARSTDKPFEETTLASILAGLPPIGDDVGAWLAGGALRRTLLGQEPDSDFDFFFRDADALLAFASGLESRGLQKLRETPHHVHYQGKIGDSAIVRDVQCIRFAFYASAVEVIDSFDFTICQFAFDGTQLHCAPFALWDLGRKRLAVHKITYPLASMRRALKYGKQGFTVCNGAISEILKQTATNPALQAELNLAYVD